MSTAASSSTRRRVMTCTWFLPWPLPWLSGVKTSSRPRSYLHTVAYGKCICLLDSLLLDISQSTGSAMASHSPQFTIRFLLDSFTFVFLLQMLLWSGRRRDTSCL